MVPVSLAWKRPLDGMEIIEAAQPTSIMGKTGNEVYVPRTDRTQDQIYEVTNLANPIALRFINANRENKTLDFLARFGRLGPATMYVLDVEHEAKLLTTYLLASTAQSPKERVRWANELLNHTRLKASFDYAGPNQAARVVFHPEDLLGLMAMEIALAHEAGAVVGQCAHCGTLYLTGPLTGRRSSAVYCSDRCRVAAARQRRASSK